MIFGSKPTYHHTSVCSFGNVPKSIRRSNPSYRYFSETGSVTDGTPKKTLSTFENATEMQHELSKRLYKLH